MVVVLAGCTAQPARPAVVASASQNPPDLICPAPTVPAPRATAPAANEEERRFDALQAAIHDMHSELQACWRDADHPTPETQYELVLSIFGDAAGSTVTETSVKRIAGANADSSVLLADTTAEPCIAKRLARVALPPGNGAAGIHMVVRSDFCTTPIAIAVGTIGAYVDAFRRWGYDHRETRCPTALADLDAYARRANTDDPWSRPYVMRCSADAFEVLSAGPDRQLGTADDLTSRR